MFDLIKRDGSIAVFDKNKIVNAINNNTNAVKTTAGKIEKNTEKIEENLKKTVVIQEQQQQLADGQSEILKKVDETKELREDKKKLEEELKNLTGASNLVVKILFFVPFIFTGIIYILNPSYFDPLFNNPLGYFVIFIIIIMLSIYIWFLRKIMKVRY